jgi:hypothetical protein
MFTFRNSVNVRIASNLMNPTLHVIQGNNAARTADPVDTRIRDFLSGDNDGSELFAALYGHVASEPISERLCLAAGLTPDRQSASAPITLAATR